MRAPERSQYRIIAVSLRRDDIAAADHIANALRDEGWPHANRSLVLREALLALRDTLKNRSPEEIFKHFVERRGRRISPSTKPDSAA
jgi:hypothetical protein